MWSRGRDLPIIFFLVGVLDSLQGGTRGSLAPQDCRRGPQYAGPGWAGLGWGSGVCLVLVVGARRAPLAHLVLRLGGAAAGTAGGHTPHPLILPSRAATCWPHRLPTRRPADSASHCSSAHSFCVSLRARRLSCRSDDARCRSDRCPATRRFRSTLDHRKAFVSTCVRTFQWCPSSTTFRTRSISRRTEAAGELGRAALLALPDRAARRSSRRGATALRRLRCRQPQSPRLPGAATLALFVARRKRTSRPASTRSRAIPRRRWCRRVSRRPPPARRPVEPPSPAVAQGRSSINHWTKAKMLRMAGDCLQRDTSWFAYKLPSFGCPFLTPTATSRGRVGSHQSCALLELGASSGPLGSRAANFSELNRGEDEGRSTEAHAHRVRRLDQARDMPL